MIEVDTPNFGELLAPYIGAVPPERVPNFLAMLERGAAARYRDWADQLPKYREGLLTCADSEDRIADIVDGLFPITDAERDAISGPLPAARETYYDVFSALTLAQQLAVQADAELQGAAAWQGMLGEELPEHVREGLNECSRLEEESSAYLRGIIDAVAADS